MSARSLAAHRASAKASSTCADSAVGGSLPTRLPGPGVGTSTAGATGSAEPVSEDAAGLSFLPQAAITARTTTIRHMRVDRYQRARAPYKRARYIRASGG